MPELEPLRARAEFDASQALTSLARMRSSTLSLQTALAGGSAALGAFAVAFSLREAIQFESAMAGVAKTVDATAAEIAALGDEFIALSQQIPVARDDLAGIGEIAGQLGIEKENIVAFTETMAALGVTTNLAGTEAATALARLSNIMGTAQTDFDRLGSTVVELGNNLATTEAEIVQMALRLAGAGRIIGLTEAEVLSFAGALSSVGISAEAGGTAVSRVFVEMQSAVKGGTEELQAFAQVAGVSAEQFADRFGRDAAGAVTAFIEGLNGLIQSGRDVTPVLEAIGLNNIRVRDALLRSAQAADLLRSSLDLGSTAWSENSALTEEAARRYETTESQLQILRNEISNLAAEFGTELLPVVESLIDVFGLALDILRPVIAVFRELPGPLRTTLAAVAALTPVVLAGATAWNIYAASATAAGAAAGGAGILGAFNALGVRIGQLGARLGPLIRSFAPLGVALFATQQFFEGVAREVDNALGPLQDFNAEIARTTTILEDLQTAGADPVLAAVANENALRRVGELRQDLEVTNFLIAELGRRDDVPAILDPRSGVLATADQLRERADRATAALGPLEAALKAAFAGPPAAATGGATGKGLGEIADRTRDLRDALQEFERQARRIASTPLFQLAIREAPRARREFDATRSSLLELRAKAEDAATAFEKMFKGVTLPGEGGGTEELNRSLDETLQRVSALADGVLLLANAFGGAGEQAQRASQFIQGVVGGIATGAAIGGPIGGIVGGVLGAVGGIANIFGDSAGDLRRGLQTELRLLSQDFNALRNATRGLAAAFGGADLRALERFGQIDAREFRGLSSEFFQFAFQGLVLDELGLSLIDLKNASDATGISIKDLLQVIATGEGDADAAAAQLEALIGAIGLIPSASIEAAVALRQLQDQLRDLSFISELFDFSAAEQFAFQFRALLEALPQKFVELVLGPELLAQFDTAGELLTAEGLAAAREALRRFAGQDPNAPGGFSPIFGDDINDIILGLDRLLEEIARGNEQAEGTAARDRAGFVVSRTISSVQANQLNAGIVTLSVQADQNLALNRERNLILTDMRALMGGSGAASFATAPAPPPSALAVPADTQIPVIIGNVEVNPTFEVHASGVDELRTELRRGGEETVRLIDVGLARLRSRSQEELGHRRTLGRV